MKKISFIVGVVMISVMFSDSCKHTPIISSDEVKPREPVNTGNRTCSPDTAYFVNDILPIILSNCAKAGCHVSNANELVLIDYNHIIQSGQIVPFNPEQSNIYQSITGINDIMPPSPNAPLTASQTNLIYKWIKQGALNNACDTRCDTINVTFSSTVTSIINNNCKGCHSGAAPSGGIDLSSYQGLQTVALNGRLHGAIHGLIGYVKMPPNGSLNNCQINAIDTWIANGAPNN